MSAPAERPCGSVIFLIHPCCYEALTPQQVRADNLELFVGIEREVKQRWLADLRNRSEPTLFAQLGGPAYLTEAAAESLGAPYALRFTTEFHGSITDFYQGLAAEFHRHLAEHRLALDPDTVRSELWGESFEGCVPGYGGAFAEYLPLGQAPRMRFEMTVHDSRFLCGHRGRQVIGLPGTDVEAWLFELPDGTGAAMFQARRHAQWVDRRRIGLRLDDRRIQVCTKLGHTVWPPEPWRKGKPERICDYGMELRECIWRWVRSVGMPLDRFRGVIAAATLQPAADGVQAPTARPSA